MCVGLQDKKRWAWSAERDLKGVRSFEFRRTVRGGWAGGVDRVRAKAKLAPVVNTLSLCAMRQLSRGEQSRTI